MKRLSLFLVLIILFSLIDASLASEKGYHLKIFYDDLDIVYRSGGTMKNVIEKADYIIDVIRPMILIKIPGPTTYAPIEDMSMDVRIRCDLTFPGGESISYGFDNIGKYILIENKVYPIDRILLKEILKHVPMSQAEKVMSHYGF